ncbi:MAG: hypothetical protein ACI4WM_09865 [Erysipelotrichaceae bacterium]
MDDLKKFENREDDWLAKQRRLESRISPWDLDDAKKLKSEHERIHSSYNKRISYSRTEKNTKNQVFNLIAGIFLALFIMMFIALVIGMSGRILRTGNFLVFILVSICIVMAGISAGGKRR